MMKRLDWRERKPRAGRIVFAITHTTPGGLLELWQDLAGDLRGQGHTVDMLAFYPHADDAGHAQPQPGWTYLLARRASSPFSAPLLFWRLWRQLRRDRPVAVITAMPLAGIGIALVGRMVGSTAVVVTHHSPSFTYAPIQRRIERWTSALGNVQAIVGVSHAVTESFRPASPRYEAKLATIPNALPRDVATALVQMRSGRAGRTDGRCLVALGRLAAQKNYPVLLRAMAHLPDATLDIVGEGEDRAALEALAAALGIAERVAFRGQMPRADALHLAASADVFVQPSLYEGHSLALIEAASMGLPLIVSDVPTQIEGVTTRAGEVCGLVVGRDDDRALAMAISYLLYNRDQRTVWSEAAIRLGQDGSMDELAAQYEALALDALAYCTRSKKMWPRKPQTANIGIGP